ncbi:MAG: AmmeMemoRadiSam system protein B, partial [Spirochaetaceae bacterium]|nr:AmmeMemoRadiSam system protein B [Spirochaetaceae bacterium]
GWYPQEGREIREFLGNYRENSGEKRAAAVLAPHAGWFYSGALAARSISALEPDADTVAVIGGHLPAGVPPLFAGEDAVITPLGNQEIDGEFREILKKELGGAEDSYRDNTVEIQIPMTAYFLPRARLLWLRLPAEAASFEAGKRIAQIGMELKRKTVLVASTDLTHYGDAYGFTPRGAGFKALEWVKTVNDPRFIEAVASGSPKTVLERAEGEKSACSAGAVLAALGFAEVRGLTGARLLAYGTSANDPGDPPDSFVGYAAMAWYTPRRRVL